MKINIFLLSILSGAIVLTSCQGRDGAPGKDGLGVIETVMINVDQNAWKYSNQKDNNYFYATVNMPEITESIFDYGLVKMYRCYDYDKSNAAQIEMPYVRLNEVLINDVMFYYTETVDYEFGIGSMTIYYTASDFDYEIDESFVPEAMQFRCVVMY